MIRITSALLDEIRARASASPGEEVCGLLLGDGETVHALAPAANVADRPATRFEVDPIVLLAAHKAARSGGPAVLGCYHSHPDGRAAPSAEDAAQAEEASLWIIAAGDTLTGWRFSAGRFASLAILPI